jgi:DNA helicase-4
VLAGAGSGKTSVLVARAGWLLARGEAAAEQILLLAFGRQAAQEMDERIRERLASDDITARTFHSLALHIIQQGSKKVPTISKLESDTAARHALLLKSWQKQCQEKKRRRKAGACGWKRRWAGNCRRGLLAGQKVQRRMASRLDRWVSLMRMHGGSQAEMIAGAPAVRDLFSKRVKLMSPLMKEWKAALKAENAVDFSGLIHQAVNILDKGRLSARGNTFWWMNFRIFRRSEPRCWPRYAGRIAKPRSLPLAMTGRRFIGSAGRSFPDHRVQPLLWRRGLLCAGYHLSL